MTARDTVRGMSEQPTTAIPRKRRLWIPWVSGSVAAVLAAGIGAYLAFGRPTGLERDDPAGAKACHQLSDWIHGDLRDPDTGKPLIEGYAAVALADVAKDAKTPAIRAAAGVNVMGGDAGRFLQAKGGPGELRFANLTDLHAACVSAGVKMPAYAEPAA